MEPSASDPVAGLSFGQMLPRLVSAHDRGLLVPFLGAGMSIPALSGWSEFVDRLEDRADPGAARRRRQRRAAEGNGRPESSESIVRRANDAARRLRLRGEESFLESVRVALLRETDGSGSGPGIPEQTTSLATIHWPLVLTTNYDDLFLQAWNEAHVPIVMEVVGRSTADCHRVLASLYSIRPPLLWALQGHLPGTWREPREDFVKQVRRWFDPRRMKRMAEEYERARALLESDQLKSWVRAYRGVVGDQFDKTRKDQHGEALQRELVVGHEEYRRVAFVQPVFRRAFAQVYRSRSLLFLGSSLTEAYFLNLFSEVLEVFGANPLPHFALIHRDNRPDVEFLRSRFNIHVHQYENHYLLPELIAQLRERIDMRDRARATYHVSIPPSDDGGADMRKDHVQVLSEFRKSSVRAKSAHVLVVGAGRSREPSEHARAVMGLLGFRTRKAAKETGVAWAGELPRELGRVREWFRRRYEAMTKAGAKRIHLPWTSECRPPGERLRFLLVEAIRAYGCWIRSDRRPKDPPRLQLHVDDVAILFDLRNGRIDLDELLSVDGVRFEILIDSRKGTRVVEPFIGDRDLRILDLAERLLVPVNDRWFVEVDPPPSGHTRIPVSLQRVKRDGPLETVTDLGLIPGATLHFFQHIAPRGPGSPRGAARKRAARRKKGGSR